ncbi:MAG: hypothetical protein GY732_21590, partial [Gammaproteobacteria bacterium]|nr:hypothetical protein [Gammaproteobacteria bacterium]
MALHVPTHHTGIVGEPATRFFANTGERFDGQGQLQLRLIGISQNCRPADNTHLKSVIIDGSKPTGHMAKAIMKNREGLGLSKQSENSSMNTTILKVLLTAVMCMIASKQLFATRQVPYILVLGVTQDAGYPQTGCYETHCMPGWKDPAQRRGAVSL